MRWPMSAEARRVWEFDAVSALMVAHSFVSRWLRPTGTRLRRTGRAARVLVGRCAAMTVGVMVVSAVLAACGGSKMSDAVRRSSTAASASARGVGSSPAATASAPQGQGMLGSSPSKRGQERVLAAAYTRAHDCASGAHAPSPVYYSAECRDVVDYGIGKLWGEGIDGAGTTIAVMGEWDDPQVARQVAAFDRPLGLPDPRITTVFPSGDRRLPAKCPPAMVLGGQCSGWQGELWLDVISAHLIAPYARILIAVTPADSPEDISSQGETPEVMQGVEAIARHHLADVVSISGGDLEPTDSDGRPEVTSEDPGELAAAASGIPVVAATGDCGPVAQLATATEPCMPVTRNRDISTWSDSPWTLAVGGSTPSMSPTGDRVAPGEPAEAAGFSSIFPRPSYQSRVASMTHGPMRSVPDITMDDFYGTSQSAPLMAGVLALATQANRRHIIGPINPVLYDALGPRGAADGIIDITRGNDSLTVGGGKVLPHGFRARKGFDVASGWGTIYAPRFIPALVHATRTSNDERAARAKASSMLATLRRAARLSPVRVNGTAMSHLTASGFLPGFPVGLYIDGRRVGTLHANRRGDVDDMIDPRTLGLTAGTHTVALKSMLITVIGQLTTR